MSTSTAILPPCSSSRHWTAQELPELSSWKAWGQLSRRVTTCSWPVKPVSTRAKSAKAQRKETEAPRTSQEVASWWVEGSREKV